MLNFFGNSAAAKQKSSTPASSSSTTKTAASSSLPRRNGTSTPPSSSAAASPAPAASPANLRKKPKPSSSAVVVTTKRKVQRPPPPPAPSRDTIEAISGYRPINALSEEKRRQILEDRHAAELEKRRTLEASRPKPAPAKRTSKQSSRAGSVASDRGKGRSRKRAVLSSSDDDDDDDDFGASSSRRNGRGSRAPSTPSKRRSVDPHGTHGQSSSYQVLGREGVAPSYSVPRNVLANDFAAQESAGGDDGRQISAIQSCEVVANSIQGFGPFFNGLGDNPRAVLQYPAPGQSEEYLLLVPRDRDEYDPLLELLTAVKAIVTNYLTAEQQKAFGSLDSLEISSNAGMILPGSGSQTNGSAAMAATRAKLENSSNVTLRARSADLLEHPQEREDEFGAADRGDGSRTPRNGSPLTGDAQRRVANGESHTAPVSPSSEMLGRGGTNSAAGNAPRPPLSPLKAAFLGRSNADTPPRALSPPSSQGSNATLTASSTAGGTSDPDSILRSFAKARNRRDGPLFLRTLARFNAEIERLRSSGAIEANIREMGGRTGVPEGVWRLVQDQVYARTVGPRVEELGRYQAFSDNVYGELLPRFMSEIAQLTNLGPGKVFVDLGSGVGNLLIQTSLQTGAEAYGCEMMAVPAGLAEKQIDEAKRRWRMWGLKGGKEVVAWKGDFGEHEGVREVLRRADVVLVNNYAFLPRTNENLSLLFLDLPDGAQIVSLKPFVPLDFRLTDRTLSSPLAILRVVERTYTSGCVSWADGGGKYFIHIVDRSLIREFLKGASVEGAGVEKKRWKARIESDDE